MCFGESYLCRPEFAFVRGGEYVELSIARFLRALVDVDSP